MSRPRFLAASWAALLFAFVALTVASYRRPLTLSLERFALYGIRLDHGTLQVFIGRHLVERTSVRASQSLDWRARDASEIASGAAIEIARERFGSVSWPPFAEPFPFASTTSVPTMLGAPAEMFIRQIETRAASAWLVLVPLTIPLVLARRHFGFGLHLAGECPACGYDLRASPERCPECGSPAADAAR